MPEDLASVLIRSIAPLVAGHESFAEISLTPGGISCRARGAAAEAEYRLESRDGEVLVSLVTPDRWLSESIESDLMHSGDPLEELVAEELAEVGLEVAEADLVVRHFRSEDRLYTFETPIPAAVASDADKTRLFLLAFEAAFRNLGDMSGGDEE